MNKEVLIKEVAKLENISKVYKKGDKEIIALDNINVSFDNGCFYAIMGRSGSGKSTLISLLGTVDNSFKGTYKLYNRDISLLNDKELALIRMKKIGFIFQDFKLNNNLTAIENVVLPMYINKDIKSKDRISLAKNLLKIVDLSDREEHFPKELSGGEQQRVSIARALANSPSILLADEPTGNLDEKNEKQIFELLKKLSENGKCIIVVSHSGEIKNYADKIFELKNGMFTGDLNDEK
ncbi:MAG: ABC transporter ATP-binding protein [Tenericutes bacterium]|nr:ABC transporter ATP-binding protein [Mycoplasmatota bacterium]